MKRKFEDPEVNEKWKKIVYFFIQRTGKKPNLNTMLFLIGIQELGKGKQSFTKEQKQEVMHIAVCKLLSYAGYYALEGHDQDGWPIWNQVGTVPKISLEEQEELLQMLIMDYFDKEQIPLD